MLRSPSRPLRASDTRPPRSPRAWAVAGCLLGALPVLLLFAPAAWLAAGVERASGGQVLFAQPRGTVWTGSAQLVLTGGQGSADRAALPGRLHWRLRPAWGGLQAQLEADCCTPAPISARAALRWGGVHVAVADGQSQWPAAVLSGLGTPFNTLQPQGRLALRTQGLALDSAAGRVVVSGQAQLDALGMSSRLSTLRPMGSYRLTLQGGEATTLTLATLDGALRLTGSGRWIGQRLRFEGEATAAPEREGALSNLLNIIGRRTGARSLITVG
ncbi:type II secretion system protein N [Acidovorax sp. PRC11]|uniref:type II secretion system protein N n=2 Tax=Pseudomonadota TaxID=1224 RepID=UPI00288280AC|nr:type II secretion system protein N [Acidovorax sp. PRC11]